jgi:predicted phage tail protein
LTVSQAACYRHWYLTSITVQFSTPAVLKLELERRVRALVGDRKTVDSPLMYTKAAGLVAGAVLGYVMLVFYAGSWPGALGWGGLLALALVGIGFNVQHDGNHGWPGSLWI